MELVDKEEVIKEIDKIYKEDYKFLPSDIVEHIQDFKDDILININTLEVKENDLVEELDYADYVRFFKEHPDYNDGSWGFEETWTFAQYCYKLGLKAQKG